MSRVAIDTNILVRLFVDDDPTQTRQAAELVRDHIILISTSVILEAAWVLGKLYDFTSDDIVTSLRKLTLIPTIEIDPGLRFASLLDMVDGGVDIADAVHVASAGDADWLATFDKQFVKSCADTNPPVRHP